VAGQRADGERCEHRPRLRVPSPLGHRPSLRRMRHFRT
jgi:hypothetical protein